MKIRRTFIIRWLLADEDPSAPKSSIDVECVQTGEKLNVSTLAEAHEWMNRVGSRNVTGENNSPSESYKISGR
jgi:hypothetical protein